jgi:excisionase family DNA binding protein
MTILTVDEAAELLKMTRTQVYNLCRARSRARMGDQAIPVIRVLGNVRFAKESLIEWLKQLETQEATR